MSYSIYAKIVISIGLISVLIILFNAFLAIYLKNEPYSIPKGSCNICLGYKAGEEITDESFQFRFTVPDFGNVAVEWKDGMVRTVKNVTGLWEYSATMTPEEYEVVFRVIERAKLYRSHYYENIDE